MALSLRKLATTATRRAFHKRLNQTFFFLPLWHLWILWRLRTHLIFPVLVALPHWEPCKYTSARLRATDRCMDITNKNKTKQKKRRWQSSLILQNTLRRLMSWRRYAKLTAHAFMKGREQDDWSLPTWGSETSSDGGWATSLAFMSRHMNGSRVRTCERKFTNWERPVPSVLGNLCLEQNCSTLLSAPIYTSSCYFYINAPVLSLSITKEAERYSKWLGEGNSSANSAKLWSFSRRVAANMAAKEKKKTLPISAARNMRPSTHQYLHVDFRNIVLSTLRSVHCSCWKAERLAPRWKLAHQSSQAKVCRFDVNIMH